MSSTSNTVMTREGSDSNSINNPYRPNNKHLRHQNQSSLARFKGVVKQQKGHCGAQIYANQQRIWLGTFDSEEDAAIAYDRAAIKLRSGDSYRNFPSCTSLAKQESSFQELFSPEAVLSMIKDRSYESKFAEYIRTRSSNVTFSGGLLAQKKGFVHQGVMSQLLFEKELTLSDVGKLNRLVIPKRHAVKFFPVLPDSSRIGEESKDGGGGSGEDVQLEFFDDSMCSWKFRYCYWKSSQSFVFTRGWNRFVKDKQLKAKDVVAFYECNPEASSTVKGSFWKIDVVSNKGDENIVGSNGVDREAAGSTVGEEVELQRGLVGFSACGADWNDGINEEKEEGLAADMLCPSKKRVKLFGIEIN